jgi:hypothetical protein
VQWTLLDREVFRNAQTGIDACMVKHENGDLIPEPLEDPWCWTCWWHLGGIWCQSGVKLWGPGLLASHRPTVKVLKETDRPTIRTDWSDSLDVT